MAGVCCVGAAVRDRKLHLLGTPVPGTSNPARAAAADGGVARNVAETLARLGVAVRLVSRVGEDDAGRAILGRLTLSGVDTSGVRLVPGAATGQYVALLAPDGDLLYAAAAMDVLDGIGPPDVDRGWRDPDWLFLDCNLPAPTLAYSLDRARRAGVPVAVDAVSTPKVLRLPRDLAGVTVFFCNQAEAAAWLGHSAVESPARLTVLLRAAGAAAVVMSRGGHGVLVDDDHVPALPADVRDVTGAGDALVAGTLAGLLAGRGLRSAVAAGTAAAALTVESEHTVRPDLTAAMIARRLGNGDPGPPSR